MNKELQLKETKALPSRSIPSIHGRQVGRPASDGGKVCKAEVKGARGASVKSSQISCVLSTTTMPVVITSHLALTPSYTGMPFRFPAWPLPIPPSRLSLVTASSRQPSMSPIKYPPLQSPHCPAVFFAMPFSLPHRTASSCRRRTSPWFSIRAQAVRNQGGRTDEQEMK